MYSCTTSFHNNILMCHHYHLIRLIYDRCYRLLCVVYQSSKGSVSPPTDNTSKLQKENICTIKIFLCMRHYLSDCRARDKSGVLALGAVYNTTRSAWLTTAFITYLLLLLFLSFLLYNFHILQHNWKRSRSKILGWRYENFLLYLLYRSTRDLGLKSCCPIPFLP